MMMSCLASSMTSRLFTVFFARCSPLSRSNTILLNFTVSAVSCPVQGFWSCGCGCYSRPIEEIGFYRTQLAQCRCSSAEGHDFSISFGTYSSGLRQNLNLVGSCLLDLRECLDLWKKRRSRPNSPSTKAAWLVIVGVRCILIIV